MKYHGLKLLSGMLALSAVVQPVQAHHAATATDPTKTVTIEGTVKTFEWTNPHVWLWVLVPAQNTAEPVLWGLEGANLSMARRFGMNKDSFKPGDKVTVVLNPLRDGRAGGTFRKAIFADGHIIDMGQPGGGPPPAESGADKTP